MPLEYVDFNAFTRIVIWSVYVGIVISSVYIFLYKSITSRFVKRLCDEKAFEIQSAKSFKELQIKGKIFFARSLVKGNLSRVVYSAVPETEETLDTETAKAEEKKKRKIKIPFDERRFYIPKEKLEKATSLYGPFKGNPIVLAVVLVILFFVCQKAIEILPSLLDMM